VYREFMIVEWPTAGRVVKVTFLVITTMVVGTCWLFGWGCGAGCGRGRVPASD
jgi:preprotein translocase subunit SecE